MIRIVDNMTFSPNGGNKTRVCHKSSASSRSRHNWRVSAASRATRVHGRAVHRSLRERSQPIFASRRRRAAATERGMRPDVGVASVDTRLRGNGRKVNQLDRDQRWRAATMSAEIDEVNDDEGDDDRGQPEAEHIADVVTRHALPGTRRRYDWRGRGGTRRSASLYSGACVSWLMDGLGID